MALPGLQAKNLAGSVILIDGPVENLDLDAAYGPFPVAVSLNLRVTDTGVISSADPEIAALVVSKLPAGSRVLIENFGEILGAGGAGGDGDLSTSPPREIGGGGGGGAGTIVGPAGLGNEAELPGSDGAPGLKDTGGAGGIGGNAASQAGRQSTAGERGGNAIECGDIETTIENQSGANIWGGGGGGGGGGRTGGVGQAGGKGGDAGQPGDDGEGNNDAEVGGAAGYSVTGTDLTITNSGSILGPREDVDGPQPPPEGP